MTLTEISLPALSHWITFRNSILLCFSILKQGNNTNLFFINFSEMYGQKHRVKSKVSLLFIILSITETIMEKQNTTVLTEVTKHSHSSGNTFKCYSSAFLFFPFGSCLKGWYNSPVSKLKKKISCLKISRQSKQKKKFYKHTNSLWWFCLKARFLFEHTKNQSWKTSPYCKCRIQNFTLQG